MELSAISYKTVWLWFSVWLQLYIHFQLTPDSEGGVIFHTLSNNARINASFQLPVTPGRWGGLYAKQRAGLQSGLYN